jgi:hypothetical protein
MGLVAMEVTLASASFPDEDEKSVVSSESVTLALSSLSESSLSNEEEVSISVVSESWGALCRSSSTNGDFGVTGTDDNGDDEGVACRGRLRPPTVVSMLTRGRFGTWLDMSRNFVSNSERVVGV